MFAYGNNNIIDFTSWNGVVGIFGQNYSGKSSLLDIILFCLFDKTNKSSKGIDILNNKST
jgi:DNA repair exonuclease SbcCD ATPase subunit